MHSTGSYLRTVIQRGRAHLDVEGASGKYDDDYWAMHLIPPAQQDVLARIHLSSRARVLLSGDLTTVEGQGQYQLPPTVQEVVFLACVNAQGEVTRKLWPNDVSNRRGRVWAVEQNRLTFDPILKGDEQLRYYYIPNGSWQPHYSGTSNMGTWTNADNEMVLSSSPEVGVLDKRTAAYNGMVLRVFTDDEVYERVIETTTRDGSDWSVTTNPALDLADGEYAYEVAPLGIEALYELISLRCALKLSVPLRVPRAQEAGLQREYAMVRKTVQDLFTGVNAHLVPYFERDTEQNKGFTHWPLSS